MKKLETTWVIAWGLLLGFGTGAATMIIGGKIAWCWVGLTAVGGWLLSAIIALLVNGRTKQRNGN
jgi:hypothetical protein